MGGRPSNVNKHERLQVARDYYMTIVRIIDAIDSGLSETEACEINHMDKHEFRNETLYRRKLCKGVSVSKIRCALESPYHKLYRQAMCITSPLTDEQIAELPPDLEETLSDVIECIGGRWGDILQAVFFDDRTFRDIAEAWELSDARVGQIYREAVRNLRRHPYKERIYYGDMFLSKRKSLMTEAYQRRIKELESDCESDVDRELEYLRAKESGLTGGLSNEKPFDDSAIKVEDGVSVRVVNCLRRAGYIRWAALQGEKLSTLYALRNLGARTLAEVIDHCNECNIALVNDLPDAVYREVAQFLRR